MTLSLSCLVTLSYSLSHSINCAGFHKFEEKKVKLMQAPPTDLRTMPAIVEKKYAEDREGFI